MRGGGALKLVREVRRRYSARGEGKYLVKQALLSFNNMPIFLNVSNINNLS